MNSRFKTMLRGKTKPGVMNKTEAAYGERLELLKRAGEVLWYAYEAITLKLAKDTRYTPDYMVMDKNGFLALHECKGYWDDKAKVKIKVASALFPFQFIAVKKLPKKDGGNWEVEEF